MLCDCHLKFGNYVSRISFAMVEIYAAIMEGCKFYSNLIAKGAWGRPILSKKRGEDEGNYTDELDEDIDGGADSVFHGVADGVAYHGCLVGF